MALVDRQPDEVATQAFGQEQLEVLAGAVRAAPSLLDGSPWRLRMPAGGTASGVAGGVELHADPEWSAPLIDPIGRALTTSCGAALRNLELAMLRLGFQPRVLELPNRSDRMHLATVLAGPPASITVADDSLYRAAFHRHGHHSPLSARPVPPALAMQLHVAGQAPGVATLPIGGEQLPTVATVLAAAIDLQRCDGRYLAQVERWLRTHEGAQELVRAGTPAADPAVIAGRLANGRLLLVTTVDDGPLDWLRAGRALQNAWLTATANGLSGSVIGAVLEAPGVRGALVERLGLAGFPQVMLRVGWA